ncbi:CDP-glycerol glycerophosphotransferase family protein [Slackia heliotrinireducens]|uniref:CDP-glycerol glycerophosphotransferase family protein n=1 Tax=Slackia heliotrinireducens TaxID=84110 RepID=UPI0033160AAE
MKKVLYWIARWGIRAVYAMYTVLPLRHRVVMMSRQSNSKKLALDMRLLKEELLRQRPDLDIVVLCKRDDHSLRAFVENGFFMLTQLRYAATSTVIVVDGYVPAVCIPNLRQEVWVLQLWHALGGFKKFSLMTVGQPGGHSEDQARILCMHRNYDAIVSSGTKTSEIVGPAFGYPASRFLPLGLPRADSVLEPPKFDPEDEEALVDDGSVTRILYAPTLENKQGAVEATFKEIQEAFADDDSIEVIFSAHPVSKLLSGGTKGSTPTIELMKRSDFVVTDYSSIIFEAALLGKKVLFLTPDIEDYKQRVGFIRNFPEDHPATMAMSVSELADKVHNLPQTAYDELQDDLMSYLDGCTPGSSSRIASEILKHV